MAAVASRCSLRSSAGSLSASPGIVAVQPIHVDPDPVGNSGGAVPGERGLGFRRGGAQGQNRKTQ